MAPDVDGAPALRCRGVDDDAFVRAGCPAVLVRRRQGVRRPSLPPDPRVVCTLGSTAGDDVIDEVSSRGSPSNRMRRSIKDR